MRKHFFFLTIVFALAVASGIASAQAPQGFGYQAVVRTAAGSVVASQQVGVRLSVVQGSAEGTARYVETHSVQTDAAGLFTLTVGEGTAATGSFAAIDWAAGPYYLRSEVDPEGGNNYTLTTTQQLLSVPYALYAASSGSATERDPLFAAWNKDYNDLTNKPTIPTVPTNVSAFTNDAGYLTSYTESQTLSNVVAQGNTAGGQLKGVSDPTDALDAVNLRTLQSVVALLTRRVDSLAAVTRVPAGFVDLGLPSGLLWAECNLGASTPEDYGNYYAWGETSPKSDYSWSNYAYCNGSYTTLTKYCNNSSYGNGGFTDALTTLQAMDDAATQALGSGARTPTKAEWEELMNNTTATWTTRNGVSGRLFTAANGNSIFLPAAGLRNGSSLLSAGSYGYCWSSSLYESYPDLAWYFNFGSSRQNMNYGSRNDGFSVRAVRASQN